MARPSDKLIRALHDTIDRLKQSDHYAWGHMGRCNCGFLAQTITKLSPGEIHQIALEKAGLDWAERAIDYCPDSGYTIDHILTQMIELGLSTHDIASLERLDNTEILSLLPENKRHLQRNAREDVILYMQTWADLLQEQRDAQNKLVSIEHARNKRTLHTTHPSMPKAANL